MGGVDAGGEKGLQRGGMRVGESEREKRKREENGERWGGKERLSLVPPQIHIGFNCKTLCEIK